MNLRARRPSATLGILMSTAFLGAMGMGLVMPVLPFLVGRFVSSDRIAALVSVLSMSYAAASFIAAPLLGALSDRFGRKPILVVSLLGSALGYVMFGYAGSLWLLIVGRVIDGLTAGNLSAVFAVATDISTREDRGRVFGYVGASTGAGFITGPAIGGALAHFGVSAPFLCAAALVTLNALSSLLLLPETRARSAAPSELPGWNPLRQLFELLRMRELQPLLAASVCFTLPFTMMGTLLAVLAKDSLGWSAAGVSSVFTLVGVSDIAVQGFALGWLLRVLGAKVSALLGLALVTFALLCMALLPAWPLPALLLTSAVMFAAGEGIFSACLSAALANAASPEHQGRVQGGNQSLQSTMMIAGPTIAGPLYTYVGRSAPYALGALLTLLCAYAWLRAHRELATA